MKYSLEFCSNSLQTGKSKVHNTGHMVTPLILLALISENNCVSLSVYHTTHKSFNVNTCMHLCKLYKTCMPACACMCVCVCVSEAGP